MKRFFEQKPLVFAFALAFVMAATEAPLWSTGFAAFVLVWKYFSERRGLPKFPRKLTGALSVLLVVQVYLQQRTLLGQEAANTLLVGLSSLKIMDYENDRDHKFLVLLGFILVSMKSIFSLDVYWILPSGAAFAALWLSMMSPSVGHRSRLLVRLFLASLPLAGFLFLAFPRILVPWAMARAGGAGMIGFSDQMDPGRVAELAGFDETAFRVRFFRNVQSMDGLYWRGTVLTESDGLRWSRSRLLPVPREAEGRDRTSGGVEYEVILEPGSKGYLFTLNYPREVFSTHLPITELQHSVYRSFQSGGKAVVYQAVSDDAALPDDLPDDEDLQIPELPPRARAWVNQVLSEQTEAAGRLRALRKFFENPALVYTLKPGVYEDRDLDLFLFERRRGFCEHFAGSYATLSRALGIPARVVIGYHGGVFNLFGDFWRVSQKDAHAWVEVFHEGRWRLQDPTDWVAPLRLHLGATGFFNLSEVDQEALARSANWALSRGAEVSVLDGLSLWLDDLNYRWNYFLLDFDLDFQKSFWLALTKDVGLFSAALLLILGFFAWMFRRLLRSRRVRKSEIERAFELFLAWGEKRGWKRDPAKSPLAYLEFLAGADPERAGFLRNFAKMYDLEVYAGKPQEPRAVTEVVKAWRQSLRRS